MSAKIIYEQPNPIPDNNGRTHGPLLQAAAKCFVAMKLLVCWQEGKSFPVCKVDIARLIGAGICTEQGVGQSGDSRMERKWWQGMGGSGLGGDDTKYQFPSCAWSACMEQCRLVQKSELSQIRTGAYSGTMAHESFYPEKTCSNWKSPILCNRSCASATALLHRNLDRIGVWGSLFDSQLSFCPIAPKCLPAILS